MLRYLVQYIVFILLTSLVFLIGTWLSSSPGVGLIAAAVLGAGLWIQNCQVVARTAILDSKMNS